MSDPEKQFPWIRVFGTIGWIVAGLTIAYLDIEKTASTFYIAAGVSVVLGLMSFQLPNTPPKTGKVNSASEALGAQAFVLLKNRAYLVFFIAAILVCIPLSFYYGFANLFLNEIGMQNAAGKMILGQVSEAIFILAIPFLFNRIGVKNMLLLGMAAWILRYVFFAYGDIDSNIWMLYAGILLHGVCYDFFFVTGYMYTEKKAGDRIKSAAQGLFTFATYGLGMFIGTYFSGFATDNYKSGQGHNWENIWLVPAYIAIVVLLYFILFFKEKQELTATIAAPLIVNNKLIVWKKLQCLGSGFIGRFYADSLQGYRSQDKIVSIYSRREESAKKFAEDYNVSFWTIDLEEAISQPDVDIVCISLPNNLHEASSDALL